MNHIPYTIICDIADNATNSIDTVYRLHIEVCKKCQAEVALQKKIITIGRSSIAHHLSPQFSQQVLRVINPKSKKHWWESALLNIGNLIAMVSVLALLSYIFTVASNSGLQVDKPSDSTVVKEMIKFVQHGSHELIKLLTWKVAPVVAPPHTSNVALFAILAVSVLMFFDKILSFLFRRS
jgi:hypothetical protein